MSGMGMLLFAVTHYGEVNYDSEEKYIAIYDAYTGEVLQTK